MAFSGATSHWKIDFLSISIAFAAIILINDIIVMSDNPIDLLAQYRYDDALRLVFLREWTDGGGWFDTTIERVAPPIGTSLHWSHYFDAPMAGLIKLFSMFVPVHIAEGIAIVAWPTIMLVAFISASAVYANRLFGRDAAAVTIAGIVLWETLVRFRFGAINIDHHGFQMLLLLFAILALIHPTRSWRNGMISGIFCAFSLAIGLEMLLPIALVGTFFFLRAVMDPKPNVAPLCAFGFSLPIASVVFFIGQTPRIEWVLDRCDELAVPILALTVGGGLAAVIVAFGATRLKTQGARFALAVLAAGAAVAVCLPFLGACFDGPYGNLPLHLREFITSIPEARPLHHFVLTEFHWATVAITVIPTLTTVALSLFFVLRHKVTTQADAEARNAVAVLLAFAILGIAASMFQLRLSVLGEAVIPLLMGYAGMCLISAKRAHPKSSGVSLAMVAGLSAMVLSSQIYYFVSSQNFTASAQSAAPSPYVSENNCRFQADVIRSLNALSPSKLMALGNLSQPILILTHHSILSAPYHRGEMAMSNLLLQDDTDFEQFRERLVTSDTDYVVLCRGMFYKQTDTIATRLATGERFDGLTPVDIADPQLVILKFDAKR